MNPREEIRADRAVRTLRRAVRGRAHPPPGRDARPAPVGRGERGRLLLQLGGVAAAAGGRRAMSATPSRPRWNNWRRLAATWWVAREAWRRHLGADRCTGRPRSRWLGPRQAGHPGWCSHPRARV